MVLHPSYRLKYFASSGWKQAWIENAKRLVRDVYDLDYPALPTPTSSTAIDNHNNDGDGASVKKTTLNILKPPMDYLKKNTLSDELNQYLASSAFKLSADTTAVQWWRQQRQRDEYPRLLRMAVDYLTVPATSVEVKRMFSKGRLLLTHTRNALSAQTTCVLMCLSSWSRAGFVHTNDVIKVVKDLAVVPEGEGAQGNYWMEAGWDLIDPRK